MDKHHIWCSSRPSDPIGSPGCACKSIEKSLEKCTCKSCPCFHTTPCQPNCSCVNPFMSHGCHYCCGNGNEEQRRLAAEYISQAVRNFRIDKAIEEFYVDADKND